MRKVKKLLLNLICLVIPSKLWRKRLRWGFWRRNVFVIENGRERHIHFWELSKVVVSEKESCVVKIELPQYKSFALSVHFADARDSQIVFHKNCRGAWDIQCHDYGNYVNVGDGFTTNGVVSAVLCGNVFRVGKDVGISREFRLWGDGHSVFDAKTGAVLNKPVVAKSFDDAMKMDDAGVISIGDHVWIGERVSFTKGAQIPSNCVVGIGAVVTKRFTEENCIIAGVPAGVKKTGINWCGDTPLQMDAKLKANKKSKK